MIDPDRLNRVHVKNVRVKIKVEAKGVEKVFATVDLVDAKGRPAGEMDWSVWIKDGCEAIRKGEW